MATSNAINSPDIDGGTLATATPTTTDILLAQDVSDGNKLKGYSVSSVAALMTSDAIAAAIAYSLLLGN